MPCVREKQSYLDSYDVDVAKATIAFPEMAIHDIRVFVANEFRPKYRYLKKAEQKENGGDDTYDNGDFQMIGGRMFYQGYGEHGTFADDFHQNQKILAKLRNDPSLYDADAHETTRAVERAFQTGATNVVTAYALDGSANRDLIEYSLDPITGKGSIHVVNTAPDGKFHTFEKIIDIAQSRAPELKKEQISDRVIVFRDTKNDWQPRTPSTQDTYVFSRMNHVTKVQNHTTHADTSVRIKEEGQNPLKNIIREVRATAIQTSVLVEKSRRVNQSKQERIQNKKSDMIRPTDISRHPMPVRKEIALQRKEMIKTRNLLFLALGMKQIPASLYFVRFLAEKPVMPDTLLRRRLKKERSLKGNIEKTEKKMRKKKKNKGREHVKAIRNRQKEIKSSKNIIRLKQKFSSEQFVRKMKKRVAEHAVFKQEKRRKKRSIQMSIELALPHKIRVKEKVRKKIKRHSEKPIRRKKSVGVMHAHHDQAPGVQSAPEKTTDHIGLHLITKNQDVRNILKKIQQLLIVLKSGEYVQSEKQTKKRQRTEIRTSRGDAMYPARVLVQEVFINSPSKKREVKQMELDVNKKLRLHRSVEQFTYGYIIWLLLENFRKVTSSSSDTRRFHETGKIPHDVLRGKKKEAVRDTDTHFYIIQALIRHMAMIREQGRGISYQKQLKTKRYISVSNARLAHTGIIYAYEK